MATIVIDENVKKLPKYTKGDIFSYKGIEFDASFVKAKPSSLKNSVFLKIVEELDSHNIAIKKDSLKTACKIFERNKDIFYSSFLQNYNSVGDLNCYNSLLKPNILRGINETEAVLTEKFREKFRNRVPQIIHEMAIASYLYHIPVDDIVDKFNVQNVRAAKQHLSPVETTILYTSMRDVNGSSIYDSDAAKYAVNCFCYSLLGKGENYQKAGEWIANHPQTKPKLLKKIAKKAPELSFDENSTVESLSVQLGNLSSESEISKIEKAYKKPGFKFRDCVFDLKFTDTIYDRYRMEILRPGDTRMVYLGYFTHCCQKLNDVGESAMMHGLLNPKAGFFCMTDERTGRVVAQAEIWEKENDPDTLVFDNIEFANDAEISLYRKALGAWLQETPYKNVYMGCGYNDMLQNGQFRQVGAITPWVTPHEIYVISYERESEAPIFKTEIEAAKALEEGSVTYFDYVYCDSEQSSVAMKENGIVEPYFALDTLPEIENECDLEDEYNDEESLEDILEDIEI